MGPGGVLTDTSMTSGWDRMASVRSSGDMASPTISAALIEAAIGILVTWTWRAAPGARRSRYQMCSGGVQLGPCQNVMASRTKVRLSGAAAMPAKVASDGGLTTSIRLPVRASATIASLTGMRPSALSVT